MFSPCLLLPETRSTTQATKSARPGWDLHDGWPISSDLFYPFGQEQNPTTDPNHYKFTGKEREGEKRRG